MSDRKAELEKKKEKLRIIREERERKRREKEQIDAEEAVRKVTTENSRKELDEMLSSLGVAPVSEVFSSLNSTSSEGSHSSVLPDTKSLASSHTSVPKKRPKLSVVSVQNTCIPPKEMVVYAKQTQTTHLPTMERDAHSFGYYDEYNLNPGLEWEDEFTAEDEDSSLPHLPGYHSKLPPGILPHGLPQVKDVKPADTSFVNTEKAKDEEKKSIREYSEEEKQTIMMSENFLIFMHKYGSVMERAVSENVDICQDYTGSARNEEQSEDKSGMCLSLNRVFQDEIWSKNRGVTSIDWSPQFPELVLASYGKVAETEGKCAVWNTKFKKNAPEFIFEEQSPVLSAKFAKFHPNLILGGTYNGRIVLWDNRVRKKTAVQRSPLSATAHTHPVFCLNVVGTQNAHNVITVSTDGRLCSWSLDMLSQPQETMDLQHRQGKPIAATSMVFPQNDVNNFIIGSEDFHVYSACRHGNKEGIIDMYEGHQAPLTSVDLHNCADGSFNNLFLSSSHDWTVKLWNTKETTPIYSFTHEGKSVVSDVAWSPTHPAVFASLDVNGTLDVWNINFDTEVPVVSSDIDGKSTALNQLSWSASGTQIAVGDVSGKLWLYDVGDQISHPRHDEVTRMMRTLQELKNNQWDAKLLD